MIKAAEFISGFYHLFSAIYKPSLEEYSLY